MNGIKGFLKKNLFFGGLRKGKRKARKWNQIHMFEGHAG